MNDVLIAGLGNPLMGDEGIGVRLAQELARSGMPGVDVEDLGAGGMKVLHAIAGRRKVVFIDCALMGEPPGTMRRFTLGEVRSKKSLSGMSLHGGDLLEVLELSRRLGECPEEVVVFGIEPESTAPAHELSATVAERLNEYQRAVAAELERAPRDAGPCSQRSSRSRTR